MKLSIVIPFHNEQGNILPVLDCFKHFIGKYDFEVVTVNDASTDQSFEIFSKLKKDPPYPFQKHIDISSIDHRGYGHAIMTGVKATSGDVIAWTHSDLQTDPADAFRALDLYLSLGGGDIIMKGFRVKRRLGQIILSFGMATVASIILGRIFSEINAQPKLFPRSFLKYLTNAPDDFSLDLFLLSQAKKNKFPIKTIDVVFKDRVYGESKWAFSFSSKIKTILRTVKYIFKLRRLNS